MNRITAYIRHSLQEIYPPEEIKALSMLICCDMLGLDALDIYMGKDIILSECKQRELENIIFRLQKNEPIQYIRGFAEFCGRNFKVASGVLIPRPETAELVELIVKENPNARRLLDIGTGSGCISIALKKNIQGNVKAVDISEDAICLAKENAKLNQVTIDFQVQDMLNINYEGYDLIISNPPYVSETEPVGKETKYEPQNALFAKENGMFFYQEIIKKISKLDRKPKFIAFEIGMTQGSELLEFSKKHLSTMTPSIEKDLTGRDRYLFIERV